MLQSGNGCDELNVVTANRARKKPVQKHFNRRSGPERTTDSPAVAPRTHQSSPSLAIMPDNEKKRAGMLAARSFKRARRSSNFAQRQPTFGAINLALLLAKLSQISPAREQDPWVRN